MMPAQDIPRSQNPTQKVFWKEEREDGAIYAVSLKKVRYRSTDKLLPSPEEEVPAAVSHLQWETWRIRTIKAGTLAKLVEHLCPSKETSEEVEPGYLLAFLTTYRTFAAASEVVQLLLERYRAFHQNEAGEKEDIVDRVLRGVISVLSVWLEQFPFDFDEPPMYPTLSGMLRCVQTEMKESHRDELARKIQQRLDKFKITPFEDEADLVTFQLPVSSNWNPSNAESDMCSIPEDLDECKADLLTMKSTTCAEQLTLMDAKLFKKVVAWHCLGCMWSKNKKEGTAPTVKATVDQFNAVSLRVISSILTSSRSKSSGPNTRAKHISCWIAVAQECRDLKNFSSLKAILSGLQSAPIHRLKKTWSHISRDSLALFQELSNIFSEDSNQQISRELLMREGTAKWAEMDTSPTKKNTLQKKRKSRFMDLGIIQGTVPYLGTFLTDLMMLDTAYPNVTEDGLINFEKRKKEFEIIAQIKLLQEAAKNYILVPDEAFRKWFDCIKTHTEHDSYRLSCEVERVEQRYSKKKTTRLRRMVSEPDISKMTLSAQSLAPPPVDKECKSTETSPVTARHKRNNSGSSLSSSSSGVSSGSDTSSVPSTCSASLPRPFLGGSTRGRPSSPSRASKIGLLRLSLPLALPQRPSPESPSPRTPHAGCIIRVSLEGPEDTNSGVIYKGIWLSDDERTPAVIRSCLTKREMEGNASDYSLVQLLSNGTELLIPDNANVYYALNSNVESLLFKLKKKKKENGQTS